MPRVGVVARAMVPSLMRISENEAALTGRLAFGPSARASVSIRPAQFEWPSRSKRHVDARAHQRDVGDLDAAGEQREEAQPRGQPVGRQRRLGVVAERHIGEADRAGREQRNRDVAAQHQIEPGDVADFGLGGLAHGVGGNEQRQRAKRGEARQHDGGDGDPRRLKPVAAVTDRSSRSTLEAGTIAGGLQGATWRPSVTLSWPGLRQAARTAAVQLFFSATR